MIGIFNIKKNLAVAIGHANVDEAGLGWRDAMLEGVFNERDEQQRCHLCVCAPTFNVEGNVYGIGQPDFHQRHIVLQELHLLVERNRRLLVLIEHVAQHLRQVLNGCLCPLAVEGRQGVDVVERIQQEVRVNLVAQVLQFSVRPGSLSHQARLFRLVPTQRKLNGGGNGCGNDHIKDVAQHNGCLLNSGQLIGNPLLVEHRVGIRHPDMRQHTRPNTEHDIHCPIDFLLTRHKIARRQPQIVGIEHQHHQQRADAPKQIVQQAHAATVVEERQGREEQNGPDGYVEECEDALIHV